MGKEKLHGLARIIIGLMFALIGLSKLLNSSGFTGFIDGLIINTGGILGWIILLSELVFGLALLVGWKVKWTSWPPLVILVGALIFSIIPNFGFNAGSLSVLFMHLLTVVVLVEIMKMGPGAWAIGK